VTSVALSEATVPALGGHRARERIPAPAKRCTRPARSARRVSPGGSGLRVTRQLAGSPSHESARLADPHPRHGHPSPRGLPALVRSRNWPDSVCGRLRACLKACSVPSLSRIGAGCCERAAGSWSAQRPRSGAAGVLDAAVRERIMGQPGQGGLRVVAAVRCSAGAFLKGVREWPATCGPGLRRRGQPGLPRPAGTRCAR
jgi:hypothetical protein